MLTEGQSYDRCQMFVAVVEGQNDNSVEFKWTPVSFDGQDLTVQLSFDRPFDISAFDDPNSVDITIKDVEFFVKLSDGWPLNEELTVNVNLPKQIDPELAESL